MIPAHPTFVIQPTDSDISQIALRLAVAREGECPEPVGSAVWVTGNLVLTARHNIEYILRKYGNDSGDESNRLICDYSLFLYQVFPGPEYNVWTVQECWASAESDLALLHVVLWKTSNSEIANSVITVAIEALPPTVGERVAGMGYHTQAASLSLGDGDGNYLEVNGVPQATTGVVQEIFECRRDSGLYNFPCYQVNARFDSGMSGGPVFNQNGRLVGVICGSLPAEDGGEATSYIATLWPMLRILISAKTKAHPSPKELYPAIDLALEGLLHIADLHSLDRAWFPGRAF